VIAGEASSDQNRVRASAEGNLQIFGESKLTSALPPKADITQEIAEVRLGPKTGHQLSTSGCPLICHPLGEVCPALTASTTMRMA
jgi:hypothetical protein